MVVNKKLEVEVLLHYDSQLMKNQRCEETFKNKSSFEIYSLLFQPTFTKCPSSTVLET